MNIRFIEDLASTIAARLPYGSSMRSRDLVAQLRDLDAGSLLIKEYDRARTPTVDELLAATQLLEARFVRDHRLSPLAAFSSLTDTDKAAWQALAARNYANVCADPQGRAEALYLEFDGELPDEIYEDHEDLSGLRHRAPEDLIEFYELGRMPAHRAVGVYGGGMTFAVPMCVLIRELEPTTVRAREGRAWRTHLMWVEGKIVSCQELLRERWAAGLDPRPRGALKPDPRECILTELYEDRGDPGSIHYELLGHALMSAPQFADYVRELSGKRYCARPSMLEELLAANPATYSGTL
jgi:hypothetical protein